MTKESQPGIAMRDAGFPPGLRRVCIATRKSRLALWQAEHVRKRLGLFHPGLQVDLLPMSTLGDELLETRLDKDGGKGLFVKELERAITDGRADLAVHSMKDMPVDLPPGFVIAAITAREDPRDAFVSSRYASPGELPPRSSIGTSSLRRAAQIAERYPGLHIVPLRGNVETRLAKLDRGEFEAALLAAAGLKRLGLAGRIRSYLEVDDSLPSAGQGALGIECLVDRHDLRCLVKPLVDEASAACVRAERSANRALGGNCGVPLGAYAVHDGKNLRLRVLVASPDGARVLRADCLGESRDPEALGLRAANDLLGRGAADILATALNGKSAGGLPAPSRGTPQAGGRG